jgi:hypothetical protein
MATTIRNAQHHTINITQKTPQPRTVTIKPIRIGWFVARLSTFMLATADALCPRPDHWQNKQYNRDVAMAGAHNRQPPDREQP